jgi:hypothetical protein
MRLNGVQISRALWAERRNQGSKCFDLGVEVDTESDTDTDTDQHGVWVCGNAWAGEALTSERLACALDGCEGGLHAICRGT